MINTILYIATSLDGYIARPDGSLDWLTSVPSPQSGDYGYVELLQSIEKVIMGRLTYNEIIGFGVDWPYKGLETYIVTTNKKLNIQSPDTYLLTGKINDFMTELKKNAKKDIWLVGGGQLVTTFLNEGLLDKIIISVIPKVIGEGISLFAGKTIEINWKLVEVKSFETGVVNLVYEKVD